jgi:hypothetical protein
MVAWIGWVGGLLAVLYGAVEESGIVAIIGLTLVLVGIIATVMAIFPLVASGVSAFGRRFSVKCRSRAMRRAIQAAQGVTS